MAAVAGLLQDHRPRTAIAEDTMHRRHLDQDGFPTAELAQAEDDLCSMRKPILILSVSLIRDSLLFVFALFFSFVLVSI